MPIVFVGFFALSRLGPFVPHSPMFFLDSLVNFLETHSSRYFGAHSKGAYRDY